MEWLEEPLRPDDVTGYRWLRDRSPIPIAAGEEECGRASFKPLIDAQALDVYQIDIARNGFTDAAYLRQRIEEIGTKAVQPLLHQSINRSGEFTLVEHMSRCFFVRGLCRGRANAS